VALSDQHLRLVAAPIDQDQGCGILRSKIGMVIGFFFFFLCAVAASVIPSLWLLLFLV
jgi:hypothetical protein